MRGILFDASYFSAKIKTYLFIIGDQNRGYAINKTELVEELANLDRRDYSDTGKETVLGLHREKVRERR